MNNYLSIYKWKNYKNNYNIGGPSSSTEFKFIDIPEMNYTSDDVDAKG